MRACIYDSSTTRLWTCKGVAGWKILRVMGRVPGWSSQEQLIGDCVAPSLFVHPVNDAELRVKDRWYNIGTKCGTTFP